MVEPLARDRTHVPRNEVWAFASVFCQSLSLLSSDGRLRWKLWEESACVVEAAVVSELKAGTPRR